MSDEQNVEGFGIEPEGRDEEERDELCSMLQVMYHFHVENTDDAEDILGAFISTAAERVNALLDQLVEETPGIVFGPESPKRYGINPEDMELSDEDIHQLLNPQGGDQ